MTPNLIWIFIAAFIGFIVSYVFAGRLKLPPNVYLVIYIPVVLVLFILFLISNDLSVKKLILRNWYWGILGAIIAAIFVIRNVLSQPKSEKSKGISLLRDILWPGFMYGLVDSLLLSIIPVLTIYMLFYEIEWVKNWTGILLTGLLALLSSSFVTVIYHLGYPEFRNKKVLWTILGNGILSLAYIITYNPLAAILPHIGMHIAAMLHGKETTGQVPPHYQDSSSF